MAKEIDIGAYSAYAIAVEHGYEGTEAEFAAQLMNSAANGALAQDGAERAEAAAEEAAEILASIPEDYTELAAEVGQLSEDVDAITIPVIAQGYDKSNNLVYGKLLQSGYYQDGGEFTANANFSHVVIDVAGIKRIKIDGTHHLYTPDQFDRFGCFFDSNNIWLISIAGAHGSAPTTLPYEVDVPEQAKTLYLNTDYQAQDYTASMPKGLTVYPWSDNVQTCKVPNAAIEREPVEMQDISEDGRKIKIIAGVIRNSGDGWEYINDAGHAPLNLVSVAADANGRIKIDYGFTAKKVLSLVVTPDETFASKYTVGGSVGLDYTLLDVYRLPQVIGGRVVVNNGVISTNYSKFTSAVLDADTGELRLYHESLNDLPSADVFNISVYASSKRVELGSQGFDYISLYLRDDAGNVIKEYSDLQIDLYAMRSIPVVHVNANNIVDAGGNFWIYGVMEID